MLTPGQFEILSYLHSCPNHSDLRALFLARLDQDGGLRFQNLVSRGLIYDLSDRVSLSPKGLPPSKSIS